MTLNIDRSLAQMLHRKFGPGWTIDDDRQFWTQLRGRDGLRELYEDGKKLERLCRRLTENANDREFMKYRSHVISICLLLSIFESFVRIIYKKLPHFFARFAAELFTEMLGRAELVAEEKAPHLLDTFGAIYGTPNGTVTNSAPPRRTAPGTA